MSGPPPPACRPSHTLPPTSLRGPGQTALFLCACSCPVMLVVGDNAPAEDGVVSEGRALAREGGKRKGVTRSWPVRPTLDPAPGSLGVGSGCWAPHPTSPRLAMHFTWSHPILQVREAWRQECPGARTRPLIPSAHSTAAQPLCSLDPFYAQRLSLFSLKSDSLVRK